MPIKTDDSSFTPRETALCIPRYDRIDRIPTKVQAAGDCRDRHLRKQGDRIRFESRRHVRTSLSPRHHHRRDSNIRTIDARLNSMDEQLMAAQIEIVPNLLAMIVLRSFSSASRATSGNPPFNRYIGRRQLSWPVEGCCRSARKRGRGRGQADSNAHGMPGKRISDHRAATTVCYMRGSSSPTSRPMSFAVSVMS